MATFTKEDVAEYLSTRHSTLWGEAFGTQDDEDRQEAAGWFMAQVEGVEQMLAEREEQGCP